MMSVVFPWSDNPEWTLKEAIRNYEKMTFERNSKRNCYVGYLNGYFYKYIHDVELHRLMMIVESNDELSLKDAVDFFITGIIYPSVVEAHPGMLVTYNMINGVQPTRIQSLQQISAELQIAYRNSDQVALFKSIYFLMTNFAGTNYRAVHRGVLMLLSIEMAEFRETFYSNLPSIIENEGAVSLAGFTH